MADENQRLTLVDEEGQEYGFTVLNIVEFDDRRYALLLPDDSAEEGAVILRIETDENKEEYLVDIEDDEEFDQVVQVLEDATDE